jgi:peptidoglycan/xylan/chitin deacetylase (PgdA/CDA1 family)
MNETFREKILLRVLKKELAPKICSLLPLSLWHRLLEVDFVLPYYHVVCDHELEHVSGIYKFRSLKQFKADMEFFSRFYVPVSLRDVINHLDGVCRLPKRCFLLTFDDGFREIYDVVAPLLYAQGIPAVFFLTTSVVDNRDLIYPQKKSLLIRALDSIQDSPLMREVTGYLNAAGVEGLDLPSRIRSITYRNRRVLDEVAPILGCDFAGYSAAAQPYLTSEQIKNLLKKGFAIGAHSVDHPLYSELSLEEQLIQTRESLGWLSDCFQYDCQAFAFPYNDGDVSLEFFEKAFAEGSLKVSFGTGGMFLHAFTRNLERFTMEKTDIPALQILTRQFGKTFLHLP